MSNQLQTVVNTIYSIRPQFDEVSSDRGINFDREAGFAVQILQNNDYALKIAYANQQSVIDAVTNVAAVGISLNPARKQAYLVPRDGKICLDISYMGLVDLAISCGLISWAQVVIVHTEDHFKLVGIDKAPIHEHDPFSATRGDMRGVYAVAKTMGGDFLTTPMSIADVFAIRDRSSAWKAWIEKKKKCPWVTDEGEMVKKTVIKRAVKLWPKGLGTNTERLDRAIHLLNTENGEGFAPEANAPPPAPESKVTEFYPQDKFDANSADWRRRVEAGTSTPDRIISMVETKFPLSDEQKRTIRSFANKTAATV